MPCHYFFFVDKLIVYRNIGTGGINVNETWASIVCWSRHPVNYVIYIINQKIIAIYFWTHQNIRTNMLFYWWTGFKRSSNNNNYQHLHNCFIFTQWYVTFSYAKLIHNNSKHKLYNILIQFYGHFDFTFDAMTIFGHNQKQTATTNIWFIYAYFMIVSRCESTMLKLLL